MIKKIKKIPIVLLKEYFRKAEIRANEYFKIYYFKNNYNFCRFRVIVSRQILPKAVIRNKIRRQLQAILIDWEKERKLKENNFDIVVIVKKIILNNYKLIKKYLLALLTSLD